jgi:hypothetical protein
MKNIHNHQGKCKKHGKDSREINYQNEQCSINLLAKERLSHFEMEKPILG